MNVYVCKQGCVCVGKAYAGSATTSVGARNNNMTSEHRVALAQIKQTDAEIVCTSMCV